MRRTRFTITMAAIAGFVAMVALAATAAQTLPQYKPPLRGAPGGRVGGASRGDDTSALPRIDLLAPETHSGLTENAAPELYYFVSGPVTRPFELTITAPMQPKPLVETAITAPTQADIYGVRLGDLGVQLQTGVNYTWSISVVVNPQLPSDDVVATATIMRVAPNPAIEAAARDAPPLRQAVIFAQSGLWYDAVAAAAAEARRGAGPAALDALLRQVGLQSVANEERATVPE
jgi:hypothetical protein